MKLVFKKKSKPSVDASDVGVQGIDVKAFKSNKDKAKYLVKRLHEIHDASWGATGHMVGVLLREVGETLDSHVNGGKHKTKRKAKK